MPIQRTDSSIAREFAADDARRQQQMEADAEMARRLADGDQPA